jgi:DMSO/TMAO reductase YedYZ molybdopterin-dependent catalytic subunit
MILTVNGAVEHPLHLQLAELKALPRVVIKASESEGIETTFEGVSLWDVIQAAKPRLDPKNHKDLVNACVVAKAKDGYQVVFSLAEIAPLLTDRKIILADRRNGETLPDAQGPLRIIVPGEKMRARWVRQVTALEIVSLLAKGYR